MLNESPYIVQSNVLFKSDQMLKFESLYIAFSVFIENYFMSKLEFLHILTKCLVKSDYILKLKFLYITVQYLHQEWSYVETLVLVY